MHHQSFHQNAQLYQKEKDVRVLDTFSHNNNLKSIKIQLLQESKIKFVTMMIMKK